MLATRDKAAAEFAKIVKKHKGDSYAAYLEVREKHFEIEAEKDKIQPPMPFYPMSEKDMTIIMALYGLMFFIIFSTVVYLLLGG